jgi:hypothetical protein
VPCISERRKSGAFWPIWGALCEAGKRRAIIHVAKTKQPHSAMLSVARATPAILALLGRPGANARRTPHANEHERRCDAEEQEVGPGDIASDRKPYKNKEVTEQRNPAQQKPCPDWPVEAMGLHGNSSRRGPRAIA